MPASPPDATATATEDAAAGARGTDAKPRFRAPLLADGDAARVARVRADDRAGDAVDPNELARRLRAPAPCVLARSRLISSGVRTRQLRGKWSWSYLASAGGDAGDFAVRVSDGARNRFVYAAGMERRNQFGSFYYVKEFETKAMRASLREFCQMAASWKQRLPHLDATVMLGGAALARERRAAAAADAGADVDAGDNEAQPSRDTSTQQQQVRWKPPVASPRVGGGPLRADLEEGVDWAAMSQLLAAAGFGGVERVRLCCGVHNSLRPCRYEEEETFLLQVHGRQRVLLFPPAASFDGLYPYPAHHPYDKHAMVDLEQIDEVRFPKAGSLASGTVAILEPGDVLYVPAFWWAHAQLLERENAWLHVTTGTGARVRAPGAEELHASRMVEERVVELEGQQASKAFLEMVAVASEAHHVDMGTVRGVQQIQLATQVRDELDSQCGRGAWARVLPRIVEGRLERTPWLDASIENPLLLADRPFFVPDTRTEEQILFPELYRHAETGGKINKNAAAPAPKEYFRDDAVDW